MVKKSEAAAAAAAWGRINSKDARITH